jgi:ribulose-phosphate 3-epimerase
MAWSEWIRDGVEVQPSLYAADFMRLGAQIEVLLDAGAKVFHFDIGDAHFVPPVTIGPVVLRSIAPAIHAAGGIVDCHLMVHGLAVGVAFNPETSPEAAAAFAGTARAEIVLCMSIHPGYSGQAFMAEALPRIAHLRELVAVPIQVDGGIGEPNARVIRESGATLLVAGNAIFADADPPAAYGRILAACQ